MTMLYLVHRFPRQPDIVVRANNIEQVHSKYPKLIVRVLANERLVEDLTDQELVEANVRASTGMSIGPL